jgi:hypothetical protein
MDKRACTATHNPQSSNPSLPSQVLPGELASRLGNATLATEVYASPLTVALVYDFGTPERTAIVDAYKHTQRLLCITGLWFVSHVRFVPWC